MIPVVRSISKTGSETMDLFSYEFVENRNIYLMEDITDSVAMFMLARLQYLDQAGDGDIHLYINSPGGSVTAGFAIIDAIRLCKHDVATICVGLAASMGAAILSCGAKGKRYASPLSEIMIHQPLGGAQGQASDIELVARHIARTKNKLSQILAENTGQSIEVISRDCDRDYYMDAEEASRYGIIDHILTENISDS